MNIKQQALGGFVRVKDEALVVRAKTVLVALEGNGYFPDPDPPLTELQTAHDDFSEKLSIARRRGSPQDTAEKNSSRKMLENVMKRLAFHVTQASEGNLVMLLSSGFEISSSPQGTLVPLPVTGVRLADGRQSGQMRLDFDKGDKALFYEYEVGIWPENTADPEWETVYRTTSSRSNIIAPLIALQRYGVRVRAVNGKGASEWSATAHHVVR